MPPRQSEEPILSRAQFLIAAFLLGGFAPLAAAGVPRATAAQPANLVLITLDCVRADHLGAYGYPLPTSPNLDRLAARGVRFETVIAQIPLTGPSHATMMTGLYPHDHGAVRNGVPLPERAVTLAERLREAGYRTGAFLSGWTLRATLSGLSQGFDEYDDRMQDRYRLVNSQRFAHQVTPQAIRWVEENASGPFFLWVHYFDPHAPYLRRRPFFDALAAGGGPRPDGFPRRALRYDSEIHYADAWIGRLLAELRRRGLEHRTLVVVTGDHGESLGERGRFGHGRHLHEEVLRVPLILAWPGTLPEGMLVRDPAAHLDLAPTILALLELPPLDRIDGIDLTPAIRGCAADRPKPERRIGFETYPGARKKFWRIFSVPVSMTPTLIGYRAGDLKFVYDVRRGLAQLFDLASAGEDVNLIQKYPALRGLGPELVRAIVSSSSSPGVETLDPEDAERLRSLGYVQ
ncbi:MAG: sulfatase [Acidobacteriota bacterium]